MTKREKDSNSPSPRVEDLFEAIERIRKERQADAKRFPRSDKRRFSRDEIDYFARLNGLTTLQQASAKRTLKVPEASDIIGLAELLECSELERDELLAIAGYQPPVSDLSEEEYEYVLGAARATLLRLNEPAFIISRDWTIQKANTRLLNLFGVTSELLARLGAAEGQNILNLIFDNNLPLRKNLTPSDADETDWETTAAYNLAMFRRSNVLSQRERWYQLRLQTLENLDKSAYERVTRTINGPTFQLLPRQRLPIRYGHITIGIQLRTVLIPPYDFPQVWYYIPDDSPESMEAFCEINDVCG